MPLSPRLLRPRASGPGAIVATDADARAYVLAVNTADGQPLEPAVQLAINAFVVGCKADGIWSAIQASCILVGARTLSGALTPLAGPAPTNSGPFVTADYNRKTGLVGNGTTKFLNANTTDSNYPLNDIHQSVYISSYTSGTQAFIGAGGGSTGANFGALPAFDQFFHHSRSSTDGRTSTILPATGLAGMSRSASTGYSFRANGFTSSHTQASVNSSGQSMLVFARNTSGGAAVFSPSRIAFYSIGTSLTLATLDSRITTLYNAIGAAIP